MLLLDNLWLTLAPIGASRKDRPWITRAEGFERAQVLQKLKCERARRHVRIDGQHRLQISFSQARGRMFIQAPPKFRNVFTPNGQSGSVRMPAKLFEQIAAHRQAVEEM